MTALFFLLAAAMIAAALAFVAVPLLRHGRGATAPERRRRALEQALAAGIIDADEYAAKRAALDAETPSAGPASPPPRATLAALLVVALLLPASALLLYRLVGTPQALDAASAAAAEADAAPHGDRGPEMQQAIAGLAARLAEHPDDVEGWALLGRAYAATNRPDEALDALRHAHSLAPDNAALTVTYAQAIAAAAPDHRIGGEARALLEQVLKTDPANQRALWLLGVGDYQDGRYDAAIARWKTLLPLLSANADVAESVRKQIADAEARRDGKAPPENEPATADASDAASPPPATTAADANAPKLTVAVALDAKLADRLDPAATLFVFARAANGPPMPLAIRRMKASELPATVTLDDSLGMMPTMKLSMFPQVVVGARVSKSGNAMPQSGDLQTLSAPLDVHRREPIALTIDQVVP
ncbi:MAG TPA: c-type cytochrome biogenesis protein CcmI [Dokdonella sp.]